MQESQRAVTSLFQVGAGTIAVLLAPVTTDTRTKSLTMILTTHVQTQRYLVDTHNFASPQNGATLTVTSL